MPRAGILLRITAMSILFGVALLLPVASSCEAADAAAAEPEKPSLTWNWRFGESGCGLAVTGRVSERGRLHFSAKLACPATKPAVQRAGAGSARL